MKYALIITLLAVTGCASTPKLGLVIPGEESSQASGTGYNENDSLAMALRTAENHCSLQGRQYTVTNQKTEYKGVLTEQARKTTDTISDLAAIAGYIAPSVNDDDDYKTTIFFNCK